MKQPTPTQQLQVLERALAKALHELRAVQASTELAMGDADQTAGDRWAAIHRLQEQCHIVLTRVVHLIDQVPMSYRGYPAYRECVLQTTQLRREALQTQGFVRAHKESMGAPVSAP